MRVTKDLVAASATPMVLGILADGESYGYAILRRINELSGGELDWTEGLLYPLLHRLERLVVLVGQIGHLGYAEREAREQRAGGADRSLNSRDRPEGCASPGAPGSLRPRQVRARCRSRCRSRWATSACIPTA